MPTTRTIDLDQATKDAGLALFTAQEAATQAYGDWLTEQRAPGTGSAGTGTPFRPSDVANAWSGTGSTTAAALAGSAVPTP